MPEFESKEDKSASETAKALKHIHDQVQDGKVEKQSTTWPIPKNPREASC